MSFPREIKIIVFLVCCLFNAGCKETNTEKTNNQNENQKAELETQTDLQQTTSSVIAAPELEQQNWLQVEGIVLDHNGIPVSGARICIAGITVLADYQGHFVFTELRRENDLLIVMTPDYRTEYIPVYLSYPDSVDQVTIDPVVLNPRWPGHVRMLFGGDVAFGRRFLDPDNQTPLDQIPEDHPEALIKASDPESGTRQVLQAIRPWYQEVDYGVFNFETPVTDNPATPHLEKDFAFYTLPGSVSALNWLGIDYVSLGNNHTYDYLEQGLIDTLFHLDNNQIAHSGAGLDVVEAFKSHRVTFDESTYGFLSMNSITGNEHSESYVADIIKGGAANLNSTSNVAKSIEREVKEGAIPIVQLHMGNEYVFEPSEYSINRMQLASDNGSPLTISHHPHVAQGVGILNGTVNVLGLGNLAFDQARLETMLGVMARVDMNGNSVEHLRMLPVYLENYAPIPISGRLASSFIRRLGEFSHDYGGFIYPYNSQGWVLLNGTKPVVQDNNVTIEVSIPESGRTIVDLRNWMHPDESLLTLATDSILEIETGRDIFGHGDFEDWDADQDRQEAARWDISGSSRYICQDDVFKGTNALCSTRSYRSSSDSVTAVRNRVRVMGDALDVPNKNLSLFGYFKGENAGAITMQTRYFASFGGREFGEENAITHPGGTFDWQPFSAVLNMPDEVELQEGQLPEANNARAVRLFIRHSPPAIDDALLRIDEVAIINWEERIEPDIELRVPHAKDFLRISGEQGVHRLKLTFRRFVPFAIK